MAAMAEAFNNLERAWQLWARLADASTLVGVDQATLLERAG
ncbi:MAG: hypothetical protein ACRD0U_00040 [Acidimicrobiales bacterium]